MFTLLITQPIFNLLVLIFALLPGHNFGVAIILFTILVRLLMWPLVKKQLHHTKAMRELQPELKRIKKAAKGNRQQEALMMMELYKERRINPYASFGILLVQFPILIALYSGINRIVNDPQQIVDFAYPFIRELGSMKELAANINLFDGSLFGVVDLTRSALEGGNIYWPAMIIVTLSAVFQYVQSRQLMPQDKEARSLRKILKDAGEGKQADQSEVSAAVGRNMQLFIPGLIFLFTVNIPSALSLYFLTSGLVAYLQQSKILRQDTSELQAAGDAAVRADVIEGEIINPTQKTPSKKQKRKKTSKNKRRKK